jgi:hypothetical protein
MLRMPNFTFVPVDEALGGMAAELAATHQIRGCDAVYVALAQQLAAPLVTLDGEQRQRALAVVVMQTPTVALAALLRRVGDQGTNNGACQLNLMAV